MAIPRTRKRFTGQQAEILEILYKFRYSTVELFAKYQELESVVYSYRRLRKLTEQEYIGRIYDGGYQIHGKPAIYYLLPEGIGVLKTNPDFSAKALNGMYRDGQRTDDFMDRCLQVFRIYLALDKVFRDKLSYFSKNELMELNYFPKPLPDAYLELAAGWNGTRYFLEFIDSKLSYSVIRGRITGYIKHFNSGDWEESGTEYPAVLLIAEDSSLERTAQRLARRQMERYDVDGLKVHTTTLKALLNVKTKRDRIWSDVDEPEELTSLMLAA